MKHGFSIRGSAALRRTIARRLLAWFSTNARDLPWRRTLDPYAIWVSEIMLQQTQVKTVIPYYECWMKELPDITRLAAASADRLHKLWEGLGYYTRVRNLQKAAQVVVAQRGRSFPTDFDAILALPGVGRYTAGAISSIAFNQPKPIVDGNVIRVLARLFAIRGNPKDKRVNERFWSLATGLVESTHRMKPMLLPTSSPLRLAGNCSALNQALMELGATVCTPANPRCAECPLRLQCSALKAESVGHFPENRKRAATTARRFVAFVIRRGDQVLVRQRPAGVVNAQLWEFPNLEVALTGAAPAAPAVAAAKALGLRVADLQSLGVVRHSITRFRVTLEGFAGHAPSRVPKNVGRFVPAKKLAGLAFASAHRRLLARAELA